MTPSTEYFWRVLFAAATYPAIADDWPQWGGPQRDSVWREEGIVETLPAVDPKTGMLPRKWTAKIGSGYAGPAVADGRVFVTDRIADQNLERVLCFDAETGKELWKHEYEARYTISYPLGPRATPTVDGNRVYTLGAMGNLFCFDVATGQIVWQKNLPADFGTKIPAWGMAGAPLVDGDQLIVLAGGTPGAMVVSLDKQTGKERWRALDGPEPGYCAPGHSRIRRPAAADHLASASGCRAQSGHWQNALASAVRRAVGTHDSHAAQNRHPPVCHEFLQRPADDRPRRRWRVARMCSGVPAPKAPSARTTACTRSCARRS